VFLYDIDDLGRVVTSNLQTRKNVAEQAEEIIDEEVERMLVRLKTREVTPTIVDLQEHLELVRAGEVERLRAKLGTLTPQQEEAIEAITRGIVNKIAHTPIIELRRKANDAEGIALMSTIRKLFRLGEG
jgi:glutamyl-tRNA reductase